MKKKRRSSQYKDNSKVIDMDEARRKRREKHNRERSKAKSRSKAKAEMAQAPVIDENSPAGKRKQSLRKKLRKRRFIVILIVLIVAAIACVSVANIVKLKAEQHELLKKQEQLKEEKKEMEEEIKSQNDRERVEEQAREKLKMAKPGETVYAPIEGASPKAKTKDSDSSAETGGGQSDESKRDD